MLARRLLLAAGGGGSLIITLPGTTIPGLAASPDQVPASPSADDEEFDAALSGSWTVAGTGATADANSTATSHLYISAPATASVRNIYAYKVIPSMPFTAIAKMVDTTARIANHEVGLFLGEASPGKMETIVLRDAGSSDMDLGVQIWTNPTTYASNAIVLPTTPGYGLHPPLYFKLAVTSSSSVRYYFSFGGLVWTEITSGARNPGFTIGSIGMVNYAGTGNVFGVATLWDFLRFS